ncbi:MAG TPA: metallophosphoesterase [Kineosporiaceae bacterium]
MSTALTALTAAGASGLCYAWVEARAFALRSFTLPVLPPGAHPLRVLHLSDIHLLPRQRRKREWLASLARLEPDLVVSTGDNIAAQDAVPALLAAHGELLDRPGVFVLGSNDYWAPRLKNPARYLVQNGGPRRILGRRLPTAELVEGFRAAGWLDLTNRRGTLKIGTSLLEFVGVDDPHLNYDRYELVSSAPDPAAELTIGVTHAPYRRVLDAMSADGATLLLAGHTHGGQLRVPGVGALVTNCDLPRRQARGVSRWPAGEAPGTWMHVSAGLGTSPFTAVRFACRPEASLLTLVPPETLA